MQVEVFEMKDLGSRSAFPGETAGFGTAQVGGECKLGEVGKQLRECGCFAGL